MFLGHFAAAFVAKKVNANPSLGTYFIASQFLDLLWPTFLLTGIEKAAISTDPANPIPLAFTDYPLSHSLLAVVGWGILFGLGYFLFTQKKQAALVVGLCVVSHWFLDFVVHIPDLPLYPGGAKAGLGLWHQQALTLTVELLFFTAAVILYYKSTAAKNRSGRFGLVGLILFLVIIHVANVFGPPPASIKAVAWMGQLQWLFVIWAYWVDGNRRVNDNVFARSVNEPSTKIHFPKTGKAEV